MTTLVEKIENDPGAVSAPGPAAKVLIADDDATQRLLTEQYLLQAGYDVCTAVDGEEALAAFGAERPDLVLLDVKMPKLDGFDVCRGIRADPAGRYVPIVMVTGLGDNKSIEKAFALGATDFISKPVVWETLSHRVRYQVRAGHAIRAIHESERQLLHAQQVARMVHWQLDVETGHIEWSPSTETVFGVDAQRHWDTLQKFLHYVHSDDRMRVSDDLRALEMSFGKQGRFHLEHRLERSRHDVLIVEHESELVRGVGGLSSRLVGTMRDITDRRRDAERIHQLAFYDPLTALPNRELFRIRAERALKAARRDVAVIFIDLDGFKLVNDMYGHAVGDELLREVAERFQRSLRGSDVIAKFGGDDAVKASVSRLGGDEFTVLLTDAPSLTAIAPVVERLLDTLRSPVSVFGHELRISGSAGIAMYPTDGKDLNELLKRADIAMYEAKKNGRDGYRFYATYMDKLVRRRASIETKLSGALSNDLLELHYQPKVNLQTGLICGVEALLRWNDPDLGQVAPSTFIPVAEESGLIVQLGDWVMTEACRQARRWQDELEEGMSIAVNLSSQQITRPDFAELVESSVADSQIRPGLLEFELTESLLMQNTRATVDLLHRLRDAGIRMSVDDFGTGYSSLAYLRDFPVDTLKIDRAFVSGLSSEESSSVIVRAIIGLAQNLTLKTIAEGVESREELDTLRQLGCDQVQGFYLFRPMPACDVERHFGRVPSVLELAVTA